MEYKDTLKLYSFKELDPVIQDNIIMDYIENYSYGWWLEDVINKIENESKCYRLKNFEFSCRGFDIDKNNVKFTGELSLLDGLETIYHLKDTEFNMHQECIDVLKLSQQKKIDIKFLFNGISSSYEFNVHTQLEQIHLNKIKYLLTHSSFMLDIWYAAIIDRWYGYIVDSKPEDFVSLENKSLLINDLNDCGKVFDMTGKRHKKENTYNYSAEKTWKNTLSQSK